MKKINNITTESKQEIAQAAAAAAAEATKTIAQAALEASKVVAQATAEAVKVREIKGADDHDLLIELKTRMEDLKIAIKELTDGTARRIDNLELNKLNLKDSYPFLYKAGVEKMLDDHENRIRINTGRITQIMTWGSAALILLGVVEFILSRLWR